MPRVVAYHDVKSEQIARSFSNKTWFIPPSEAGLDFPVAHLSEGFPAPHGRVILPHFHPKDEFLVTVAGSGKIGRHDMAPYSVFFARAYTPYGPLSGDPETGITFFVLFARHEVGADYLPESRAKLMQVPNRRPWQLKRHVKFPEHAGGAIPTGIHLHEIPDLKDERGLFGCSLSMGPDTTTVAPDPSHGGGQYIVVVRGSMWHYDKEYKSYTLVFLRPDEGGFMLSAGSAGLEAIILNFPEPFTTTS